LNGELEELFQKLVVEKGGASIATTLTKLSALFIGIGLVVVLISFMGACGALCKFRVLLGLVSVNLFSIHYNLNIYSCQD